MPNPLFDALFAPHAGRQSRFLDLEDGRSLTHAQFLDLAGRYAHALGRHGLRPGDRVAVQVGKSAEALALYAATVQAGMVFLPLNTAYTGAELGYFIADSGAALLVCDPADAAAHAPLAADTGARLATLDTCGGGSLAQLASDQPARFDTVARGPDDLVALLYTSGTTGRPKGAMLTQRNLLSNAQALTRLWRFTPEDVLIHALPIFHTHGLFVATNVMLLAGGRMILQPGLDTGRLLDALPGATALMGVPTFYTRLLDDPGLTRDRVAGMRLFISGSAPLLEETHRRFAQRTGHRILERYGMTETNMIASNPYDGERRPGTVGFALPGVEVRITDAATAQTLAPGEIGQIEVRGPNVFAGYWGLPEKTAEDLRPDGWFITGDLGRFDADGYLAIVGRNKDLIIAGGYNIYPKEVELALDDQPGVLESAVIGVPHPDLGEAVVGVLVPEAAAGAGADAGADAGGDAGLDTDAIRAALADRIARFKQPRALFVVDALPRNAMGKVQKNALRVRFAETFARRDRPA